MRLHRLAAALPLLFLAMPAVAAMQERPLEWEVGGMTFQGVLVHDDAVAEARPGLLMVPNWMGITDANVAKARELAGRDYVVLVVDMYGEGVRPSSQKEAGQVSGALREDRPELRRRITAATQALRSQAGQVPVDPQRVAAVGFCFGGTTVLELARSGADIAAVASLHGGLATPLPATPGEIRAPVLVLNGAADRSVSDADIQAFEQEMDAAGADWHFVNFGGAVHCFAEADAGTDPESNCRYDPRAAARAYRMLDGFLRERFAAG